MWVRRLLICNGLTRGSSGGMVAPAFLVFSLFTFPAMPLALCIKTPQKDKDKDKEADAAGADSGDSTAAAGEGSSSDDGAGSSSVVSMSMRYTVMVMCAAILFLGVGAEIGYGTWIATFALEKLHTTEVSAALISSSYYGGFLFGRLAAVPLSTKLSPLQLLYIAFAGGTIALLPLVPGVMDSTLLQPLLGGGGGDGQEARFSQLEVSVGASVAIGLFIAPVFAACMSVTTVAGLPMTSAMMSFQVSGAVLGEMLVTVVIGARISEDIDEFGTLNLGVMACGLVLCVVLSAILARLPPPPPPPAAQGEREGVEGGDVNVAAAEREALLSS
eukprot:COSAG06_NODE_3274_length_5576_cov_2.383942_2_plen_330_part_00